MSSPSFLVRHEFLLRRLHSLTGLIPVGAYMIVHLLVNSTILTGATVFQKNVYQIHSLEDALVIVEWTFIFLPILFHAILGVVIIYGGLPNVSSYPTSANFRYTLQRATGMIAFVFIVWHVFHLHGWFHFEWWIENVAKPWNGANFRAYNAASTLGMAMSSWAIQVAYAIGILACVFHLANGIWTMGITWGVWTSQAAQSRALAGCGIFGVLLAVVGLSALFGAATVDVDDARKDEDRMYHVRVDSGDVKENTKKRSADRPVIDSSN
ncbi:MAG: succinate dehydrogenase cytochrome b558 subunit [Pirellulaceae bacterium]|nr:succinate dehydrogenase cytochrome b558 subunit [Pirellulaceae bacterium]